MSLRVVSNARKGNKSALLQAKTVWCEADDKPLPEPIITHFNDLHVLHVLHVSSMMYDKLNVSRHI